MGACPDRSMPFVAHLGPGIISPSERRFKPQVSVTKSLLSRFKINQVFILQRAKFSSVSKVISGGSMKEEIQQLTNVKTRVKLAGNGSKVQLS